MRAIAAKLLEAKMDQLRQVVIIGYVSNDFYEESFVYTGLITYTILK